MVLTTGLYHRAIITPHSAVDEIRHPAQHFDFFSCFALDRLSIIRYQRPALKLRKLGMTGAQDQQNLALI